MDTTFKASKEFQNKQTYGVTLRRLRQNSWVRGLVTEARPSSEQFIQPLFLLEGLARPEEVPGLAGVYRETSESILKQIENDLKCGVRSFLLFLVPAQKSLMNSPADFRLDFAHKQIRLIREHFGDEILLFLDVCLCSYTQHGHCGLLSENSHGAQELENVSSVEALTALALTYVQSGADGVAPSDMMDGRVAAIRSSLDQNSLGNALIMSYSAKFHSRFYGPFRLAADSAPKAGSMSSLKDRASYQIDPASPRDAYLSSLRDAEEGADILMVKPGLPYLDILKDLSSQIKKPWAVYQVSGEYASIELLAKEGFIGRKEAHREVWTSFVRAGASIIISYGARHAQEFLKV